MYEARAVHVLECFEGLPEDVPAKKRCCALWALKEGTRTPRGVLFVDILQDIRSDGRMQVGFHVLENEVEIPVVVRLEYVRQRH